MSLVEIVFSWIFVLLRFLWIIFLIVAPIAFLVCLIRNIVKQNVKKSLLCFLSLVFVPLLFYLTFLSQSIPGKVDKDSVANTQMELLELNDGSYSFDTGYICGDMYVDSNTADLTLVANHNIQLYRINDSCMCYVTDVLCSKDERWYYLFYPTISSGEIIIAFEKKTLYIDYHYSGYNLSSFLGFVTNPEIVYRKTIQIDDIISSLQTENQSDYNTG